MNTKIILENIEYNLEICRAGIEILNIYIYNINTNKSLDGWQRVDEFKIQLKRLEKLLGFEFQNNISVFEGKIQNYKFLAKQKQYFFKREKSILISLGARNEK